MNTIQLSPKDAVQHEPLVDLVEEITARLQAGEPLDIDQYIADYPEYADKLRNWITVITAMAELGGVASRRPSSECRRRRIIECRPC
jgi:hypothetical protein